jgi:hypothetical protein
MAEWRRFESATQIISANEIQTMKKVTDTIPGYSYGSPEVVKSPVSMGELAELKRSASFTEEDERYLRLAGEVLADQTKRIPCGKRSLC